MNIFNKLMLVTIFMGSFISYANDIQVKHVSFNKDTHIVSFDLSWQNSWRNQKNYDAAWVFVKFVDPDGNYTHGKLGQGILTINGINGSKANYAVPSDKIGIFIEPAGSFRGNVNWHVQLTLDSSTVEGLPENATIRVFAIEMVYIPDGSFYIGATEQEAVDYASFYESDASGNPAGPYLISSEDHVIKVSPTAGDLFYKTGNSPYRGDHTGTVPASFPKGYQAFYIMKYEMTQGLYAEFLNAISPQLAAALTPQTSEGYYEKKGGIRFSDGKYTADTYDRPANFITWDDGATFADWAGLRPMTELEYTKAARGTVTPFVHEFPWGTDDTGRLKRKVTLDDELVFVDGISETDLNEQNRPVYGASYYWVMDLAGSLWEKCVTVGDEIGRNYLGTHGDGVLSGEGTATNADWPKGISEEGGYGYRGGGYYYHGMKISDFNPHSPTSYRPYGSWAGGKRSIAYSQRYVRTATK